MIKLLKTKKGIKYGAVVSFEASHQPLYLVMDFGYVSCFGHEPEPCFTMMNLASYEIFPVPLRIFDGMELEKVMRIEGWLDLAVAKVLYAKE